MEEVTLNFLKIFVRRENISLNNSHLTLLDSGLAVVSTVEKFSIEKLNSYHSEYELHKNNRIDIDRIDL